MYATCCWITDNNHLGMLACGPDAQENRVAFSGCISKSSKAFFLWLSWLELLLLLQE